MSDRRENLRLGSGTPPIRRGNLRLASGSPPAGRGLMLVLARSASDEDAVPLGRAASSEITASTGLPAGQTIDDEGLRGRTVYIIRDEATGQPVGVRKFVSATDPRPGHYIAVQREARNYQDIQEAQADWADHILPFRRAIQRTHGILLDFDWIHGTDVQTYLEGASRREAQQALDHAARQLRWLALAGYRHGDVKAENIYRTADGRILLFDFDSASKFINPVSTGTERSRFMAMIAPYVSERTTERLTAMPFGTKLHEFYLMASRLLRREARPVTYKTRRRSASSRRRGTRRR